MEHIVTPHKCCTEHSLAKAPLGFKVAYRNKAEKSRKSRGFFFFFFLNFYLLKDRWFLEDLREKGRSRCFDVRKVVWRGESEGTRQKNR